MSANGFLHGVEVINVDDGPRSIRTVDSATIGIIGTAPDADETEFPYNQPILIAGSRLKASKLDTKGAKNGTLPAAVDLIFDQIGAVVVAVRVPEEKDAEKTAANIIGGVTDGQYTGIYAFLGAKSITGRQPRILIAPGFTHQRGDNAAADKKAGKDKEASPAAAASDGGGQANPVVAKLIGIAERLGAVIFADCPNTTDEAALQYAKDFGSKRIMALDPNVKTLIGSDIKEFYFSAAAAGLTAKTDYEQGFWVSPSNKTLNGIVGTARPVDFALGDKSSRANLLNEGNVTTIIRENGYRMWGNRTLSDDPKWKFLSVVRTADMINEALLQSHLWAVDRNITKTYIDDVSEGVNAYMRSLKAAGAILGGSCTANKELNSAASITEGQIYFDVDFTPTYPAERITFRSRIVNDYIEELF